jgi:hypothetical protein
MKGHCHEKCKWAASHVPAKDIPEAARKSTAHTANTKKMNRESGQSLAVSNHNLFQNLPLQSNLASNFHYEFKQKNVTAFWLMFCPTTIQPKTL